MWELRNKLYDENENLTSKELDILSFESDFKSTYNDIYNNEILDDFLDRLQLYLKWESIIENPKNKDFFRRLYEESWIVITSDRELTVLRILYREKWYWLEID